MKRILALLMSICIIVCLCSTAFAQNSPLASIKNELESNAFELLYLYPLSDGSYSTIPQPSLQTMQDSSPAIVVHAKDNGGQIYLSEVNPSQLFMKISETRLIQAQEIKISDINELDVDMLAAAHSLSSYLTNDLKRIAEKSSAGEIAVQSLAVYTPYSALAPQSQSIQSSRTYTGYNGNKYYEEILDFKGNSTTFNVVQPPSALADYATNTLTALGKALLDYGLNKALGKTWTLVSIFSQNAISSIPTTKAVKHTAALIENKQRKYTYIYEYPGADMQLGSIIDCAYDYRFQNYLNYDGDKIVTGAVTPQQEYTAEGYDSADKYAYLWYLNSGYQNLITGYLYINSTENINTTVDSLF